MNIEKPRKERGKLINFFCYHGFEVFLSIEKNIHIGKIMGRVNTSHSHVNKTVKRLQEGKLIEAEKEGRIVHLRLTKNGEEVQSLLKEINHIFKKQEEFLK